jgi:hypothetical protein
VTALALASFDREAPFREAVARAGEAGGRIAGLWSPYPVAIADMGEEPASPIPWIACAGGLGAAFLFYAFIWWTATQAYPFDSGARPLHSWPVFLIAPIEFGALAAGIAGLAAFILHARLTRLHDAAFEHAEVEGASSEHFVIALACDAGEDANALLAWVAGLGAVHSRLVTQ